MSRSDSKYTEFGPALREARRRHRATQKAAGAQFGISQPSFARWELGQARPDMHYVAQLANFMAIPVSRVIAMLDGTGSIQSPVADRIENHEQRIVRIETIADCFRAALSANPAPVAPAHVDVE